MPDDPSDPRWLLRRSEDPYEVPAFAQALVTHVAAALRTELAGLLITDGPAAGQLFYETRRPLAPVELEALRARAEGQAEAAPGGLHHLFHLKNVSCGIYLEPVEDRDAACEVLDPALRLLDVFCALAVAREEAAHDELTSLLNYRSLTERLGELIAQGNRYEKQYDTRFSIVLLDLDNFKWFNDAYGHQEGNNLLRELARTLQKSVRRADIVFRYGGDEFVILLPHTDPDQAEALLRRVAKQLDGFLRRYERGSVRLGFSAGISHFPTDGRDADTLIRCADERLYRAKEGSQ